LFTQFSYYCLQKSNMRFNGQTVIVTGAGAGIGRQCAIAFAFEGARVIVADVHASAGLATETLIREAGGTANAYKTDVSDEESVRSLLFFVEANGWMVNTLLNNAAIQVNKPVNETTWEEWNRQMTVNVGGVFLCSKYFLPHLKKTKGSIINMSSVNAFYTEPSCAGYCATKAAIIGLTRAMAIDHGKDGIRVNCVCPGYIDAGLAEGYFQSQADPQQARLEAGKLQALGRIGAAGEVAKMALFLASEEASFVTGASMVVDGGFSAGKP
jgi:NAD(P)-dependent dehydrogenase (short-subunit alcohol dehydrogenase family)